MANKKGNFRICFLIIALFVFGTINSIHAQTTGNVKVDLSVLDEMARQINAQKPRKIRPTPRFDVEAIKIEQTKTVPIESLNITAYAPKPKHKPIRKIAVHKGSAMAKVPLPKHCPAILHASDSFIKQARAKHAATPPAITAQRTRPVAPPATPVIAEKLQHTELIKTPVMAPPIEKEPNNNTFAGITDPLEKRLITPNVQGVLRSLEAPTAAPSQETAKRKSPELTTPLEKYVRLEFIGGEIELNERIKALLEQDVITALNTSPDLRIEIQSFATAIDQGQSSARRVSLTRAVNIRSYLIQHDIEPKRIDIRALGEETVLEPIDRADLFFIKNGERL